MNMTTSEAHEPTALWWLAVGTFAVGTEGFVIAGILPKIAADLEVSVGAAGQLVTIFAFCYAFSSPILTTLLGGVSRRKLLIGAMGIFTAANLVAACASNYWMLAVARVLLAFAAGVYVPGANALGGALVAPEKRGRALAIVNGGLTIAVALGVPLGAFIGNRLGWRSTFEGVAVLGLLAILGLSFGLSKTVGAHLRTPTFSERIRVAADGPVLRSLIVTCFWATGTYSIYTYLSPFASAATTLHNSWMSAILFAWGVAAAVGIAVGGHTNDRHGSNAVVYPTLIVLIVCFAALSFVSALFDPAIATYPFIVLVVVWGIAAWAFYPAQQARLLERAGVAAAPIALSLNASFMYFGFSIGAFLGSIVVSRMDVKYLGWVGCAFELTAFIVLLGSLRTKQMSASQVAGGS